MTRPLGRRLRAAAPYAVLAAVLLLVGWLTADRRAGGPPLDPRSTAPDGTKALVDTLERLGAEVVVTGDLPDASTAAVLVLSDAFDDATREALRRWAADGGVLVVADPSSPLTPDVAGSASLGVLETTLARHCDLPALAGVERVSAPGGVVYETPDAPAQGCFPRGEGHWLVVSPTGAGAVVALGGTGALVNAGLGHADNAVLAASLLVAADGVRVQLQQPPLPGSGDATLLDLVPTRVLVALAQLGVAFLVLVAWRARRLGAPVGEPRAVALPGSELTVAVGALLHETGARAQAAAVLRGELQRTLAERFGLPPGASADVVAEVVAARGGLDVATVRDALTGPVPGDDAGLVALAGRLDAVRAAALGRAAADGHEAAPAPADRPEPPRPRSIAQ